MSRWILGFLTRPRNLVVIVACIVATAMVVVAVTPIADPDVWWVAAAGRAMLAGHAVPRANVFSFVEPGHAWLMHEWLFGPLYALGLTRFGPAVFSVIALAAMATDVLLLALGTIGRARNPSAGLGAMLAAVAFFGGRFLSARPTGVALVFPIALTLLAFSARFDWRATAAAVLLELGWANAHGSFPLGVVLVLVAAAERREDRPQRLTAAGLMALATLANPYGLALHRFVWGYFRGSEGVYRSINLHIKEFGSFWGAWGYTVGIVDAIALGVFVLIALGAARQPRYRVRAAFCLALFALALRHARHFELAGLVACLLLLPYLDDLTSRLALPAQEPSPRARVLVAAVLAPPLAIALGAFAITAQSRERDAWVAGGPALLSSVAAIPDGANAFVPFPSAGLVIWYASPRGVRVFFDSRNDCYSAEAFAAFWSLETADTSPPVRRAALADAKATAALVPATHPMAAFLAREPGWALTRQEGTWRVYRREP